ncbi:hypothetical protein HZ326_8342 [Fusarium oxysporum f. sp. albedinis]|nr:hypothetical protein HZ326_8342 [Fusarium oxysporum f. sp. albedinis]
MLRWPLFNFNSSICQPLEKESYNTYLTAPILDAGEMDTNRNAIPPYQMDVCINHSSSVLTQSGLRIYGER